LISCILCSAHTQYREKEFACVLCVRVNVCVCVCVPHSLSVCVGVCV
jgi:hypothetical protein